MDQDKDVKQEDKTNSFTKIVKFQHVKKEYYSPAMNKN